MKQEINKSKRCPKAQARIAQGIQIRPFNEEQKQDGSWHFVHRCLAHEAAITAWTEGVTSLAAWLVDNAEGEQITEELLLSLASRCMEDSDPLKDYILEKL